MSEFILQPFYQFPDPNQAEEDGLLGHGGDLSPQMVLSAYLQGVFPWYDDSQPVLWWSPDPRYVLYPSEFKTTKSLRKTIRNKKFEVRYDTNFDLVIRNCSKVPREDQDGTWITDDMIHAYNKLHEMGFAHSVETYYKNELVGGLYGLTLGKVFCGESMFHVVSDASKVAFYYLVQHLVSRGFMLIDAQVPTQHLKQFGAREVERADFLQKIKKYISLEKVW